MPLRPPKAWWERCVADVSARDGHVDAKRVCGAVWKRKSPAEKRAIVALEEGGRMAGKKKKKKKGGKLYGAAAKAHAKKARKSPKRKAAKKKPKHHKCPGCGHKAHAPGNCHHFDKNRFCSC